ncbi:MAG TPA: PIG-L family deacetylase [Verrucomicrobiae bacterium]|nr:PIG-L family deacetylase [Verrucomicrobiae bacterium]
MATTLMAIAAHPGDAVFTMGAAVAQHIHGGGTGVFVSLTAGEKGAPANTPVERYGELQRAASEKAAKLLGAEFQILGYPDAEVPLNDQAARALSDVIRQHKADIVVTHWSGSWHKDHQNCHLLVRDAIFYAGLSTMVRKDPAHAVRKLFFADNWEDAENFKPDTYLDITAVSDKWMQACDAYPMWRGQTGFFRYNDYYSSLAVMRGCLSGFRQAVALMSGPAERPNGVRTLG